MEIDFSKQMHLDLPPDEAWQLISDVHRVAACIPQLSDLRSGTAPGSFVAEGSDRVGPFRVAMPIELTAAFDDTTRRAQADLSGTDRKSQTRIRGTLSATCIADPAGGTEVRLEAKAHVSGPVATLGAGPLRRRVEDILEEFASCIAQATPQQGGLRES